MASAFKNFFITFAICLLAFGFVGLKYAYPLLSDMVDFTNIGETASEDVSENVSEDTSDEISLPVVEDNFDENGDVFTAVVMCVDSNGRAVNSVLIDSNGKTKQFIYCSIPSNVKCINDIGATVPVGDLFSMMSPEAICQSVSVMTGIETKYCLRFDREGIKAIAEMVPGASVVLNEDIIFINPEYADYIPVPGSPYPDDYYITISNVDGKVLLNETLNGKTKLEWLLSYNPNTNGEEYNTIYSAVAKSVLKQFFKNKSAMMSTDIMAKVIENCETNLTTNAASEHLPTIFSYNDYNLTELTYPANWETAVSKLRELDGSFNRGK